MIGGSSRDYLLGRDSDDFDFVTDATPEQEKAFLPDADFHFAKYGSIHFLFMGKKVDVVTLREEVGYQDHRHPSEVNFITDKEKDSWRRDFTINALYIDKDEHIYDYHGGLEDLRKKQIRFIGDPNKRIEEDPIRILRAERFAARLGFDIEEDSAKAIASSRHLLSLLNPEKVKMELKKN